MFEIKNQTKVLYVGLGKYYGEVGTVMFRVSSTGNNLYVIRIEKHDTIFQAFESQLVVIEDESSVDNPLLSWLNPKN